MSTCGNPSSLVVGTSGSHLRRSGEVTARIRDFPACTKESIVRGLLTIKEACPPATAVIPGAAPGNETDDVAAGSTPIAARYCRVVMSIVELPPMDTHFNLAGSFFTSCVNCLRSFQGAVAGTMKPCGLAETRAMNVRASTL